MTLHDQRRRTTVALGWAAAAIAAPSTVVRLAGLEARPALVALSAVSPWLLPPALLAVVAGLRGRDRALVVVAGVLALAQLGWVLPEVAARQPAGAGAPLRLLTANLLVANRDPRGVRELLVAEPADVVVLQELGPAVAGVLDEPAVQAAYPHRLVDVRSDPYGSAVLARVPLESPAVIELDGLPMTAATVQVGGRAVRVVNVHTMAPLSVRQREQWQAQLAGLAGLVRPGTALVLAGDFNATDAHRGMAALSAAGLHDAARRTGGGLEPTWPVGRWFPPLLRLDRVLVADGIGVVALRRTTTRGSDHRALVADLVVGQ